MTATNSLRVLVADHLETAQLAPLEAAGILVDDRAGISAEELPVALVGCAGLLVRSRTRVTAELLEGAPGLRVIGRAGTGVDNVDCDAATRAGVVVMNVPGGNAVAAAEQTIALLFALARHTPRANASVRGGRWERKEFVGVELTGKTLGVVGLGRIGQEVARRGIGLGMNVMGFDPVLTDEAAERLGVTLASVEELARHSDFLTVHVPLTDATRHLIDAGFIAQAKPGIRILNVARGGIVDEAALLVGLENGSVAGAGLDVYEEEPPTNRALLEHPAVVATPHLGASTLEAQSGVARQIAEQVARYLSTGEVVNAVNVVGVEPALLKTLAPWLELSRRLGAVAGGLVGGLSSLQLTLQGEIAAYPDGLFVAETLRGLLRPWVGDRVNIVNSRLLAEERGIIIGVGRRDHHKSFQSLVRVAIDGTEGRVALDGTLFGRRSLRIVRAYGFNMDAIPEGHLIFCANEDRPGVIGHLGTRLAEAGINIANMSVGRDRDQGHALAVINVDSKPSAEVLARLADAPGIRWIRHVDVA